MKAYQTNLKLVAIACAIALLTHGAFGQFRKYSNEFLNIGAGARALGMGGASVTSVKGPEAGYWNPSALTTVTTNPSFSAMHAEYFGGIGKYDYGSVAFPVKDHKRTLAFTLLRFAIDDIPNTLFLVDADGTPNYNNIESFSSADYAGLFSLGQVLKESEEDGYKLSVGGTVKIIHRNVGSFAKAWGFGLDASANFIKDNWRLGAVLRDATSTFNTWSFDFSEREKEVLYLTRNEIPVNSTEMTAPRLMLGGSYDFIFGEKATLTAEAMLETTFDGKRNTLIKTSFMSIDPRLGLEFNLKQAFFLRAGVGNFQQALKDGDTTNTQKVWIYQPSLGAGFKIKNVGIDYAFSNLANQSSPLYTHVVSLFVDLRKNEE
jgi:hypothetical protein